MDDIVEWLKLRADALRSEGQALRANLEEQAAAEITRLRAALDAMTKERDAFRAVLEGAEYGDIDGIAKASPEHCRALGQAVKGASMASVQWARLNAEAERDRQYDANCDFIVRIAALEAERDAALPPAEAMARCPDVRALVDTVRNLYASYGAVEDAIAPFTKGSDG